MSTDKQQAVFFFNGNLQDFLLTSQKGMPRVYSFTGKPSVKDAIEAMGVPHVEVGAILMNGSPVSFQAALLQDAQVEVFPEADGESQGSPFLLRPGLLSPIQFVVDVHLGKLARLLRMLGFDTLYDTTYSDQTLAVLSNVEKRVVLTRDIGLLKQKAIHWGYWLRSQIPEEQLMEVLHRFHLKGPFRVFVRCLVCNHQLEPVQKEAVVSQLEPKTKEFFKDFYQCTGCCKVYWKGSHYDRMESFVRHLMQTGL